MHKAHLKQRDPRCDTRTVLQMALRMKLPAADFNEVAGEDCDWNLHWPDGWAENHFNHFKPGRFRRVRPCTHAEASRQPRHTPYAVGKKYRKRVGRRWVVPFTVEERQRQAVRMGKLRRKVIRMFWEAKSPEYGTNPAIARRSVAAKRRAGGWHAVMFLITMRNPEGKAVNFADAGEAVYPMLHGHPEPAWVRDGIRSGRLAGHQ